MLQRSGVEFPRHLVDAVPTFTQITRQTPRHSLGGRGIPSNSTRTLDEAMASDTGSLRYEFDLFFASVICYCLDG